MKWKRYTGLMLALLLLLSLTACGAAAAPEAMRNEMAMDAPMEEQALGDNSLSGSDSLPQNRKWVITLRMQAETEDLDAMLDQVFAQAEDLGGYVEDQNIHNGTAYAAHRYRSASLTVRIPAQSVDAFTEQVEKTANLVSSSRNLEDITLQYVDTETRLKALEVEEARLLELMEQAETMSDLLEIEGRLTEVRYEKERITSQLRTYDNQVNFATVYLDIEEVLEYTPVEEPTVWERISGGFVDSLRGVGQGFADLLIWLIVMSPYLVIWALVILAAVFIIRKCIRRKKKSKTPKEENKS